ncbi:MAG: Ig-like domain-containing protein [Candidatus Magasanikbacteria bacterium]
MPQITLTTSGTILPSHFYAWSNNVGFINFKDTVVNDSSLTGYAWSQNNGWIKMNLNNGGVINDGQGNLSGSAWGEGLGWINFSGVSINSSGVFSGTASGDLVGTLTFGCTKCDVQTDWRATPSGGGGSNPPPPPPPPVVNFPTGSLQINNGVSYSNSLNITLSFVADYTDTYAVSTNNDFGGASYSSIVSSTQFTLPVGDGTKTVYVSFKNQDGTYVASDSIILDTTSPNKPTISQIDLGIENGKRVRPPKLSGQAEANSQIIITKTTEGAQTASFFYLAGVSTYYTTADNQGNWTFTFSTLVDSGNYAVSVVAQDAAGNISDTSVVEHLVIPKDTVIVPPEDIPENTNTSTDDTTDTTDNTDNTDNADTNTGVGDTSSGSSSSVDTNTGSGSSVVSSSTPDNKITTTTIPLSIVDDVKKAVENVTESVKVLTTDVGKNIVASSKQISQTIANVSKQVADSVNQVVDNSEVEAVNKQFVTPVVATVAVLNVASSGFGILNVVNFLQLFFGQFFLLFRIKKQKKWGVLYNALTKKPIDLASIRLIDLNTNKVARSTVTDLEGRYILSAQSGNYKIEVNKNGYMGFSAYLKDVSEDSAFINLYHGENIKVTDESEINYNIPLDPIEENKNYIQIIKDKTHKLVRLVLSTIGLAFSIISFVISPVWWVGLLVIFQFLLYIIVRHFSYSKLSSSFGLITVHTQEKPLSNVVVRVFDAMFNKLVETAVSDRKGRYAILLGPSKYYVTYEKEKYEKKKSPLLDFSSEHTGGLGGILVRDEFLDKKA